ncbi:MAG: tRNA lysidine(34) synthetase TilS [Bacteroidia bacterium]|nr:tRNA lysidine(34) synthetase TilS [Bacteroidia bacterium]
MSAIEQLQQALLRYADKLLPTGQQLLIACSGGSDSVSLAATAHSLNLPFAMAHVNYGLRGAASDLDQALVAQLAHKWQVDLHLRIVQPSEWNHNASTQAQARDIRYAFFQDLMSKHGFGTCLLAHHQEDQAETILLSLLRGNGYALLSGMPEERPGFLRPFLTLSKHSCQEALEAWGISWREDATNAESKYLRNLIRNEAMSILRQVNPAVTEQLTERARWYEAQLSLLGDLLDEVLTGRVTSNKGVCTFSWEGMADGLLHTHLQTMVTHVLYQWGWHGHDLWQGAALAHADPGKRHMFQGMLVRGRSQIQWLSQDLLLPSEVQISLEDLPQTFSLHGRTVYLTLTSPPSTFPRDGLTHYLDLDRIQFPLQLSSMQEGDRMQPFGMKGSKLLSDIMIDERFRPAQKHRSIVLRDQHQIVAMADFRVTDSVKVTKETTRVISLVIEAAD